MRRRLAGEPLAAAGVGVLGDTISRSVYAVELAAGLSACAVALLRRPHARAPG